MIEKTPFQSYTLDEDKEEGRRTFTVSVNLEEDKQLQEDKKILQQTKDSTAIKQLAELGHFVLHSTSTGHAMQIILENKRKNQRLGITEFE